MLFKQWLEENPLPPKFQISELERVHGIKADIDGDIVIFSCPRKHPLYRELHEKCYNIHTWQLEDGCADAGDIENEREVTLDDIVDDIKDFSHKIHGTINAGNSEIPNVRKDTNRPKK